MTEHISDLAALLPLTLAAHHPIQRVQTTAAGTRLEWLDEGVMMVDPATAEAPVSRDLLLSAGVHGNETAPVELLDRLVRAIASDQLIPRCRLLLMFANPAAIRCGERYLDYDLNRLFSGRHQQQPGPTAHRAALIEQLSRSFFEPGGDGRRERIHYDLHTAIRPSAIEKFALYPDNGRPLPRLALARLDGAGISAVVRQQGPSSTFSAFTANDCGCDAMTLELGQARPFGANDGIDLSKLEQLLSALIRGGDVDPATANPSAVSQFIASREIIKQSSEFRLHLSDDVANFTPLSRGMVVADDQSSQWVVHEENARILFPNPKVKVGLRAAILVVPAPM